MRMVKELKTEYPNPEYPVSVKLFEKRKECKESPCEAVRTKDLEFIVVRSGTVTVECGEKYILGPKQALLILRGVPRKIVPCCCDNTGWYSIVYRPEFVVNRDAQSPLSKKYYESFRSLLPKCLKLEGENLREERALRRLARIIEANIKKKPGFELVTLGNMALMWADLLEHTLEPQAEYTGKNVPARDELRVIEAKRYIDVTYYEALRLEDIAAKIHVSRNECCRAFKRVLNMSPVDYLIRRRVFEAAKVMYKDPLKVDSVSELAINVGFNTISYFNRMFKRYMLYTPTEFAAALKQGDKEAEKRYYALENTLNGGL